MSNHDSLTYLKNPPQDGITNIDFHGTTANLLLSSSWDKTIRLHDTSTLELKSKILHNTPILDTCFGNGDQAFSAGLDGHIYRLDLITLDKESIGQHSKGVKSICWSSISNILYSGSWDKSISSWDTRTEANLIHTHSLPQKVYSMDLQDNTLAVALPREQVYIYDTRKMNTPRDIWDTKLNSMLKSVQLMPSGQGIACSSMEGRVSVNYFNETQGKDNTYVFKLHRQTLGDSTMVYPVNSLSFHPTYGTLASGGSDGVVDVWDVINRKRIRRFSKYPEEVSNVAFNNDGSQLAIAYSYTYDEGERPKIPDAISIRTLDDNDCKSCPNAIKDAPFPEGHQKDRDIDSSFILY